MKLTGENRSTRRKTCPSATFSTTNPTRTDPASNPALRGERQATNRLSHAAMARSLLGYCISGCRTNFILVHTATVELLFRTQMKSIFYFCWFKQQYGLRTCNVENTKLSRQLDAAVGPVRSGAVPAPKLQNTKPVS